MRMGPAIRSLALATIILAPAGAHANEAAALKFGFYPPVSSYVNTEGMTPWIQRVERDAGGALSIKLFAGPTLGNERNMYDRTLADVAQIGYSTLGPHASQFPRAQVAGLPFVSSDPAISSPAMWRLYTHGALTPEFNAVKVLGFLNFPNAALHTNKPIRTLDDLKGMKLAVSSRVSADVAVALGASPVTLTPTEFYEGLQRGLAEGAVVSWTAVKTFKLDEVTKYHLEVPLGEAPAFVFMNKAAYAHLPKEAQQAIDKESGEGFSRILGANNEAQSRAEAKKVAAEPGQSVTTISAAQFAAWKSRIDPVIAAWARRVPDGAKVLEAYRSDLKRLGATN